MPLLSQSSENVDSDEPSETRWSFQDFEQAYERKFTTKWFKGSSHTDNEPLANGNAQHQQSHGPQPAQNGSSPANGNGVVSRNKIPPSTAVYEQYLNKMNDETPGSNGASTNKLSELWPPKPLPDFGSPEMNELAQSITRDIVRDTSDIKWETIKGLENAKRLMKEAVVMPIKYPQYFKGLLSPWKGILLFGPPGTGKTMLAKAVASECNTTFFNISASSIVSKWRVLTTTTTFTALTGGASSNLSHGLSRSNQKLEISREHDEFKNQFQRHVLACPEGLNLSRLQYVQHPNQSHHPENSDSEKLVKVLFELARHFAPSTIFLDEIDAIISQRGEGRSEHEASRRLKTELLVQLYTRFSRLESKPKAAALLSNSFWGQPDIVASIDDEVKSFLAETWKMDGLMKSNDLVFLLAATNLPWELDGAMLRRLEKRILVPLPEPEARRAMCLELLLKAENPDLPYDDMVKMTEGYSGSDIRIVCKEAAMRPLRRLMVELEKLERSGEPPTEEDLPKIGPVTEEDVRIALETTRPSAHLLAARYEQFDADFGSRAG